MITLIEIFTDVKSGKVLDVGTLLGEFALRRRRRPCPNVWR
jgi:hypothetical protein